MEKKEINLTDEQVEVRVDPQSGEEVIVTRNRNIFANGAAERIVEMQSKKKESSFIDKKGMEVKNTTALKELSKVKI